MPIQKTRANNARSLNENPEKRLFNIIKELGERLNSSPGIIKLTRPHEETYSVVYGGYGFEISHSTKGYTFWPQDGYKGIGCKAMLDIFIHLKT